eukprot:scaffold283122_cov42-Prasinocladus_malaysianus.AAC.2
MRPAMTIRRRNDTVWYSYVRCVPQQSGNKQAITVRSTYSYEFRGRNFGANSTRWDLHCVARHVGSWLASTTFCTPWRDSRRVPCSFVIPPRVATCLLAGPPVRTADLPRLLRLTELPKSLHNNMILSATLGATRTVPYGYGRPRRPWLEATKASLTGKNNNITSIVYGAHEFMLVHLWGIT